MDLSNIKEFLGGPIGFLNGPIGLLVTGGSVTAGLYAYKIVKQIVKPVKQVTKLYDLADKVIEHLDNEYIDKIRSPEVKKQIQKDLKKLLELRITKIKKLIIRISD